MSNKPWKLWIPSNTPHEWPFNRENLDNLLAADNIKNLYQAFEILAESIPNSTAISDKRLNSKGKSYSYQELKKNIDLYSLKLLSIWVKKWNKLWLISENSPESVFLNLAAQSIWAVVVPWTEETMSYWINQSQAMQIAEVDYIFMSSNINTDENSFIGLTKEQLGNWDETDSEDLTFVKKLLKEKKIVLLDSKLNDRISKKIGELWIESSIRKDFLDLDTQELNSSNTEQLEEHRNSVELNTPAVIMYCSWTWDWWTPKSVKITHWNILHQVKNCPSIIWWDIWDKALEILPQHHIFQYIVRYVIFAAGSELDLATVEDLVRSKLGILKDTNPEFMIAVTRIWVALRSQIEKNINKDLKNAKWIKKYILEWVKKALKTDMCGVRDYDIKQTEKYLPDHLNRSKNYWKSLDSLSKRSGNILQQMAWRYIWYKMIIKKLWLQDIKVVVNWWWALPPAERAFFEALWISIKPWYGLTESTAVWALPPLKKGWFPAFTSWLVTPWTNIHTRELSELPWAYEIIIEWPHIWQYTDQNLNEKLIPDWKLETWDMWWVLAFNGENYIYIDGRAKNIIKNAWWETIMPELYEDALRNSPYVEECMVVWSESYSSLGVIIAYNKEQVENLDDEQLKKKIKEEIQRTTGQVWQKVKITNFLLIEEWFTQELLSRSHKLIRPKVERKYWKQIEKMMSKNEDFMI